MPNLETPASGTSFRRRPSPLPPMRLGRFAGAALIGLRVLLGLSAAMAVFAAIRGPQG
jgi:hypothetical protein